MRPLSRWIGVFYLLTLFNPQHAHTQVSIDTLSATTLVHQYMVGENVKVYNVNFTGSSLALGLFRDSSEILGMKKGIMLSSGNIFFANGPNKSDYISWINQLYGDEDLQKIAHGKTYDAAVLEFDFVPASDSILFEYVFASEEYNEYVGSKFNDVFGFWIQKKGENQKINVGIVGEKREPVTVNTINNNENKKLFIDNHFTNTTDPILWDTRKRKVIANKNYGKAPIKSPYNIQFDGFTKVLTASLIVEPGEEYHIKMAISDVADAIYDSWVIIKANSFSSRGNSSVSLYDFSNIELDYVPIKSWKNIDHTMPELTRRFLIYKWIGIAQKEVTFQFDRWNITRQQVDYIDQLVHEIDLDRPYYIYILGHTDSKGSEEYNIRLSSRRVNAIYRQLLNAGIPAKQILKDHFGEYQPIDNNETELGRARNRRVEINIYYLEES